MEDRIYENLVEKSLIHTDEQLTYVRGVLDRHILSPETRQQILKRIEIIEQRCHDRNLYLGVVGEFNSGKSTFINALLRDPLLKARMVATTATETRIVHGKELAIEVTGHEGQSIVRRESAGRSPFYRWLPQIADLSVREIIPVVTDESESASQVRQVTIKHPSPFLAEGVVVIDTPGTNATHQEHGKITKRIVEDEADMAVILIPANQPVSMSLVGFLSGPLKPLLHRCVFVLTKMDLVREREQQEQIRFVTERLSEASERQDVMVLPSAPQIVLDLADPDCEDFRPDHQGWVKSFSDLETRLHQRLRDQRDLVITEHVMRLMTDLLNILEAEVNQAHQRHLDKGALITKETIRDLQTFLNEQEQNIQEKKAQKVRQAKRNVSTYVTGQKTSTVEAISRELFATTNSSGLKNYVESKVETALKSSAASIQSRVKTEGEGLSRTMKDAAADVNLRFNEEYKKLSHLSVALSSQKIQADADVSVNAPSVVQNAMATAASLSNDENARVSLGVLGGVIIGAILIPGIGAVIGPLIGGWLFSIFGPSLSQQQSDVWEKLSPKLLDYYDQVERSSLSALDQADLKWGSALSRHLRQNGDNYEREVSKIKKEHERERKSVAALQATTKQDLDEISRRKKALEVTSCRLKQP